LGKLNKLKNVAEFDKIEQQNELFEKLISIIGIILQLGTFENELFSYFGSETNFIKPFFVPL
jgi:hypothetical protein